MKIWTWQECLNYLQSHPRQSNHFSKSHSPCALLKFIPDQLFVLFLWLNPWRAWTWQDCINIWWLHPWHSNYCLSSTPQLEPQVLQTPTPSRHAQCITGSGWRCLWAGYWSSSQNLITPSLRRVVQSWPAAAASPSKPAQVPTGSRDVMHWQALARVLPSSS